MSEIMYSTQHLSEMKNFQLDCVEVDLCEKILVHLTVVWLSKSNHGTAMADETHEMEMADVFSISITSFSVRGSKYTSYSYR